MSKLIGMSGNRYLLDTVIVAAYFNDDKAVRRRLPDAIAFVSSATVGELYYGAYKSQQVRRNVEQIKNLPDICTIVACDETTADYYGQIRLALRIKGRPIPENDVWIAATAVQYGLTLVSRDAHFQQVDGLQLEVW